ncbi:MAG: alanine racemase [Marinirhabdus sp.]|nr:alanine racemase [Marinirhabdus sp.]
MEHVDETVLTLDLNALSHNFEYLSSKISANTKVLAVIKAFGYGSDSIEIAKELETLGVAYFAVAYVKEGVALRDAGIRTPILVLHPQSANFETLIDRCLEPSLYSTFVLKKFIEVAEGKKQKNYPVHLKFNTGLNRLGFDAVQIADLLSEVHGTSAIHVKSVFSHLAASEDPNEKTFTEGQIEAFKEIAQELEDALGYHPVLHLCNTSGGGGYPEAHFDMVRIGIGLYGFGNAAEVNAELLPIATLSSIVSQIHHIQPGDTVGYNRAYKANDHEKTATIPIGHADGISRAFGNGVGWVTIHGKKAPIIGNVCMDMLMVNITGIDCEEGDEVVLFGQNPTADELSAVINSIPYELITGISQRVKRVVRKR